MNSPRLIGYSEVLANELGVDLKSTPEFDLGLLSGNNVPLNAKPFALCYGGHQFGNWAGQLGDGRAITLGDFDDPAGNKWEFQLKGSGLTPYSRGADGKAVLRSSIREFLASEAMYALGVPTTRALSLVTTGEMVMRDMFYDGNPKAEKGAIVSRLAPSFIRFGNFEILAAQNDLKLLEELINWSIEFHFKDLLRLDQKERQVQWFKTICRMTAELMCEWLRVGFVHGVMNTDNMSILGLTIDYGPFGFLEEYDPSWTPNTTDLPGRRYCFGRQAPIAFWNLQCLASALNVLPEMTEGLEEGLSEYHHHFEGQFFKMMSNKLGLKDLSLSEDQEFLKNFDDLLKDLRADMTLFYRKLSDWNPGQSEAEKSRMIDELARVCYFELNQDQIHRLKEWLRVYSEKIARLNIDPETRKKQMDLNNPKYILRNWMAYQIHKEIEENDDLTMFNEVSEVLKKPYEDQDEFSSWAQLRPNWAKDQPGSSTLSCSS